MLARQKLTLATALSRGLEQNSSNIVFELHELHPFFMVALPVELPPLGTA
jgi:hypothetical protein